MEQIQQIASPREHNRRKSRTSRNMLQQPCKVLPNKRNTGPMVAYNFKLQFADDVESGVKRQTIRANGKRRHARQGEALQLYTGMRTTSCRKLRDAVCVDACPIRIEENAVWTIHRSLPQADLDAFAKRDGFPDWPAMRDFFAKAHGLPFSGTLIRWLVPPADDATPKTET